jgi:hypothetical protein
VIPPRPPRDREGIVRPPWPRRPDPGPWTPFGPTDLTQLDARKVQAGAEKLKVRIEEARLKLEEYRRGPAPPAPPHFPGAPDVLPDQAPPRAPYPVNRADALVPFLLIRSYVGDVGARPLAPDHWNNVSPDVIITQPMAAPAPPEPPVRGRDEAQDPAFVARILPLLPIDTIVDVWIHVWNLGRAPAFGVRVRAWAFGTGNNDPFSGFLGGRRIDLGARDSETSHVLVRVGQWPTPNGWMGGVVANAECITDVSTGSVPHDLGDRHFAGQIWANGARWKQP